MAKRSATEGCPTCGNDRELRGPTKSHPDGYFFCATCSRNRDRQRYAMRAGPCSKCGAPKERGSYCGPCFNAYCRERWARRGGWSAATPQQKQRHKARSDANHAIRDGRLVRGACGACGSDHMVQAHHDDYDRPLDVRWLCRSCHRRHHATARAV